MTLLEQVVAATSGAEGSDALLDAVAQVLARLPGVDLVLADRLDDPDLLTRVAVYDAGRGGRTGARRSTARAVGLLPRALAAGALVLSGEDLAQLSGDADPHVARQADEARAAGLVGALVLPCVARGSVAGALVLGSRTGSLVHLLPELRPVVAHVAVALDAARLLVLQAAVAAALQRSLLPPLPAVPGLQLAARYAPAAQGLDVGGDWYDAFVLPGGDLVLAVGDVRGHDLAAAVQMADLRNLVRAYAVDRAEPPSAVLARTERTADALGLDVSATCLLARAAPLPDGRWDLAFASAGHLPPLLLRAGRVRLVETEPDLLLGLEPSERADHRLLLEPGDLLLLLTDGLVETRTGSLDEGLAALAGRLEDLQGRAPDDVAEALLAQLGEHEDDVALLVLAVPPA